MNTNSLLPLMAVLAPQLGINKQSLQSLIKRARDPKFFTVTLPSLGKDVDRSLSSGRFVLTAPFKKKKGCAYPNFCNELFELLYDKEGYLITQDYGTLRRIRQLCFTFYKLELPFEPLQEQAATEKFINNDSNVKCDNWDELAQLRSNFVKLFPENPHDIKPRHSNGATASRLKNYQKISHKRIPRILLKEFGAHYWYLDRVHIQNSIARGHTIVDQTTTIPSVLKFVPKDSRGPRAICMEPHELMYIQQGLMHKLYEFIETISPARGRINFTDQSINQELARSASIDRSYATIDLKDASDFVSWDLIKLLLPADWYRAVNACRSRFTSTSLGTIELKKFAPMGSALCFPIEAMLFYSICTLVTDDVYVYGDDIIVPTDCCDSVIDKLISYGLHVNLDKTLSRGPFRESCGSEYIDGYDIQTYKLKSLDLASIVEFANLVNNSYGLGTCDDFITCFEDIFKTYVFRHEPCKAGIYIPANTYFTNMCSRNTLNFRRRWSDDLQRYEYRCINSKTKSVIVDVPDDDLYFDWLSKTCLSNQPVEDSTYKRYMEGISYRDLRLDRTMPLERGETVLHVKPSIGYTWVSYNIG